MNNKNKIIENIISDDRVKLVAYYGSNATKTNSKFSDIDLIVILNDSSNFSINGIHLQNDLQCEYDFLFINETFFHEQNISKYLTHCILSNVKIIKSKCQHCLKILQSQKNIITKTNDLELENIYWHLKHIIFKAKRSSPKSPEILFLWSKFVYYITLLWPRIFNQPVLGGMHTLKQSNSKNLINFLNQNLNKIPEPEIWEEFINQTSIGEKFKNQIIFSELNNLIQPYTPITVERIEIYNLLKDYIKKWIDYE